MRQGRHLYTYLVEPEDVEHWKALSDLGLLDGAPSCRRSKWGEGKTAILKGLPYRDVRAAEASLRAPEVQAIRREIARLCKRRIHSRSLVKPQPRPGQVTAWATAARSAFASSSS